MAERGDRSVRLSCRTIPHSIFPWLLRIGLGQEGEYAVRRVGPIRGFGGGSAQVSKRRLLGRCNSTCRPWEGAKPLRQIQQVDLAAVSPPMVHSRRHDQRIAEE